MMNRTAVVCGLAWVLLIACGLWADPPASAPAAKEAGPPQKFEASDTDGIKAAVDKNVIVHGTVSRTAWSPRGSVMFINFQDVDRNGFTAIVRKAHKDAVSAFGEDGAGLVGKAVEISGKAILYNDKPEVEVTKAEQIKVVEAPAAAAEEKPKEEKPSEEKPKEEKPKE
jgi:DNA/RNA endonuclease YhcR with UshA esterase domain